MRSPLRHTAHSVAAGSSGSAHRGQRNSGGAAAGGGLWESGVVTDPAVNHDPAAASNPQPIAIDFALSPPARAAFKTTIQL